MNEDNKAILSAILIFGFIFGMLWVVPLYLESEIIKERNLENYKKDLKCSSINMGKYAVNDKTSDLTIDNVNYIKCERKIYNQTSGEIISTSKWTTYP